MSSEEVANRQASADADAQQPAPEFTLPGTDGSEWSVHSLRDYTADGVSVLGFYPLCSLEQAAPLTWLQFTDGVDVVLVTDVREGSFESQAPLPGRSLVVLLDPATEVGDVYGVDYRDPSTQRIFLVDSSNRIVETWSGTPDPKRLHAAVLEQVASTNKTEKRGEN